jgi:hypothetical protein
MALVAYGKMRLAVDGTIIVCSLQNLVFRTEFVNVVRWHFSKFLLRSVLEEDRADSR